jgi:serine/threonine-protein kinase
VRAKGFAVLGQTIGNYKITERLGEGGMGVVYLAEHPALGRKAAIKVLHPQMAADPQVVSRFFQEARASNAIRHPNIVETYDFGTLADGASYIIMEYLDGENLSARLKRDGRQTVETAVDFACQAAGALAAAHDKRIVHRDLKPDNIFVTPDPRAPGQLQIKILDFGIAKLADQSGAAVSHKTRTGTLMGTPLYMSPEQCLGVREVDHRTDIYSLGCILFEMLVGAPPFVSEGFGALINMHINEPPVAPSRHNPDVPRVVDDAVLRMLAKNPSERFDGMVDIQELLFPLIAEGPGASTLRPTGSHSHPGRPMPRLPTAALRAAATTLSSSAAATSVEVPAPVRPAPPRARRPLVGTAAVVGGLGLAAVLFVTMRPHAATEATPPAAVPAASAPAAPEPKPAPAPTAAAAPAAPAAPAPAAAASPPPAASPPEPATVDVVLDSDPAGALVTADGAVVGTTPTVWKAPDSGRAATLSFALDGYKRASIQAVPARGLRLAPALKRASAHHQHPATNHAAATPPPNDIKSER